MDSKKEFSVIVGNTKIKPDASIVSIITTQIEFLGLQDKIVVKFSSLLSPSATQTVSAIPDDAYCLTLICSFDYPEKYAKDIRDKLYLSKGPTGHVLSSPIQTGMVVVIKKTRYAIVPKPEALECLRVIKEFTGFDTISLETFIVADYKALQREKYNTKLVNTITCDGEAPPDAVYTWEVDVVDCSAPLQPETQFTILACDIRPNLWLVMKFLEDMKDVSLGFQ